MENFVVLVLSHVALRQQTSVLLGVLFSQEPLSQEGGVGGDVIM